MENSSFDRLILDELKKTNRLLGILITKDCAASEKILLLSQAGLAPKEISETLGVSSNLVSVTIYNEKKKTKKKK